MEELERDWKFISETIQESKILGKDRIERK